MTIRTTRIEPNLTVFTIVGDTSFEEIMATLRSLYAASPTRDVMWDLRAGTISTLSYEQLNDIVDFVARVAEERAGGKTALVTWQQVDYGIARSIDGRGERRALPFNTRTFRSYDNALHWLSTDE